MISNRSFFIADNLDVLSKMDNESVDLIYLDPPYNSGRNYYTKTGIKAFQDKWSLADVKAEWVDTLAKHSKGLWSLLLLSGSLGNESIQAYLTYIAIRLIDLHRILRPTGSIYIQCDSNAAYYIKLTMDAIFSLNNFRSNITWHRTRGAKTSLKNFPDNTDVILYYTKSSKYCFNPAFSVLSKPTLKTYNGNDYDGRGVYCSLLLQSMTRRPNLMYDFRDNNGKVWCHPLKGWSMVMEKLKRLENQGRLILDGKTLRKKGYWNERDNGGKKVSNLWHDISQLQGGSYESTDYPTQKPLALLDRIITASSNKGDTVLDPFCGSATTCVAAEKLGRRWVGIDINPQTRELVELRLEKEMNVKVNFVSSIEP